MSDSFAPRSEDDTYREALSVEDRAVYDRVASDPALAREIKALRLLLYKMIRSPEAHSREILTAINTLCRVIYTQSRQATDSADLERQIFAAAEQVRGELAAEDAS